MAEARAGDLLTLWKVGRVELPKIALVYTEVIASVGRTADVAGLAPAGDADQGAGPAVATAFGAWADVRDELLRILTLCADRTAGASHAVGRAISEHTRTDADGTDAGTVAGQQLWQLIHDPNEVDPGDPDQMPPGPTSADEAAAPGPHAPASSPGYLPELTRRAEAIKTLVIERKKDDDEAFQGFVRDRFKEYADDVSASYEEWQHAYEGWWARRDKDPSDSSAKPVVTPVRPAPSDQEELRAAYERHVEESCEWIIPAFQAWAVPDPDALTPYIAAMRAAENRLGDGRVVRVASSAQINLASQWDGAYCTGLRNFLAAFLVIAGNQQAIARTLRELLEAEQAVCRQAQENMIRLAENILEAIRAAGQPEKSERRTYLTILSAITWIAGAVLAIPSGGASIYAGVVTLNAVAAATGAAASLLPGGDPRSLDADTVDGVLEKMSQVMTDARGQMTEKQNDIIAALTHNQAALTALRQDTADTAATPVTPSRPAILTARQGEIGAHLHPR
jgi:hypothetical protein